MKKDSSTQVKFGDHFIITPNKDKISREKPIPDEPNYIPWYLMLMMARPDSGKSEHIKNLIIKAYDVGRPFERMIVIHGEDAEQCLEYEDYSEIAQIISIDDCPPSINELRLNREQKNLIVLEDVPATTSSKAVNCFIDSVYRLASHFNCCVIYTTQNLSKVSMTARRCATHLIIWRPSNMRDISIICRQIGEEPHDLKRMLDACPDYKHDGILIDIMGNPRTYKRNLYSEIGLDGKLKS